MPLKKEYTSLLKIKTWNLSSRNMNRNIIAIDGPAGSGKSTVAKEIAKKTDFFYFDSGAFYRAVTLFFLNIYEKQNPPQDLETWVSSLPLNELVQTIQLKAQLSKTSSNSIYLNGEDVSEKIRTPQVTNAIQYFANNKSVREFVNKKLHELSQNYKLVMDGRDIGTQVFPDAVNKFFLVAKPEVRATRRYEEWKAKGIEKDYKEILHEILQRDKSDSERELAPLKKAEDAIEIDTSQLSISEMTETILSLIHF